MPKTPSRPCCPTCGRALSAPRAATTRATLEAELLSKTERSTDWMSDKEVHAHYASISAFVDVRTFMARQDCVGALRVEAEALYFAIVNNKGKHTAATKRAYVLLMQHWRETSNRAEREAIVKTRRERILSACLLSAMARESSRYAERMAA